MRRLRCASAECTGLLSPRRSMSDVNLARLLSVSRSFLRPRPDSPLTHSNGSPVLSYDMKLSSTPHTWSMQESRGLLTLVRSTPVNVFFIVFLNSLQECCIENSVAPGCQIYCLALMFLLAPVVQAGATCHDVLDSCERCSDGTPENSPPPNEQGKAAFDRTAM